MACQRNISVKCIAKMSDMETDIRTAPKIAELASVTEQPFIRACLGVLCGIDLIVVGRCWRSQLAAHANAAMQSIVDYSPAYTCAVTG